MGKKEKKQKKITFNYATMVFIQMHVYKRRM